MTGPGCGWSKISRVRAPYDNLDPAVKPLQSPESAVYIMDSLLGRPSARRLLMGRRAEDGGRSECPPVAGGIGVESSGEITPRESGPTSLGSFVTREPGKPLQGASR